MSTTAITDDGFMTATVQRGSGRLSEELRFSVSTHHLHVGLPGTEIPPAVDVQWDGNGTLRLRMGQDGQQKLSRSGRSSKTCVRNPLDRLMGDKKLAKGRYPITRIDGNDVYIDVSNGPL